MGVECLTHMLVEIYIVKMLFKIIIFKVSKIFKASLNNPKEISIVGCDKLTTRFYNRISKLGRKSWKSELSS